MTGRREKAVYNNTTQRHFGTDHVTWLLAVIAELDRPTVLKISMCATEPRDS